MQKFVLTTLFEYPNCDNVELYLIIISMITNLYKIILI